jgi:integrase
MKFTDTGVRALKPRASRFDVTCDGRAGLQLRVFPSGTKTFVYRYQLAGEVRRATLGNYPEMSIADACIAHAEAQREVRSGLHPSKTATATRTANLSAPKVPDLLDEFVRRGAPSKRKRPEVVRQLLQADIVEPWTDRLVSSITRRDIVVALDRIVDRGAPTTANKVASLVAQMFAFAVARGMIDASPAVGLERPGGAEEARTRWLDEGEIAKVWAAIETAKMEAPTRLAIRILLATGQRRSEIAKARWSEIDLDAKHPQWLIPAANSKNGLDHVVPLPPLAADLFRELRASTGRSPFVLPSFYSPRGQTHIAPETLSQAVIDLQEVVGIAHWTLHDLRRTARTHLASLGVQTHVAERVIGHKQRGIIGVYDRHEYLPEKRAALALWNEYLAEIVAGASHKVVPLRASGRAA